jgi:amidohydrolase
MNDLLDEIRLLSARWHADTVAERRHLHQNPELSFQEKETGLRISKILSDWGISHEHGVAENGVVAIIEGLPCESVVALRADFDALPILEQSTHDYVSTRPGVMHACGHDGHTASLLTAARILWATRDRWYGTVKLIFQPAEEKLPGGASIMIAEGVLKNPAPLGIIGQHVTPNVPVGKVGFREGIYMASTDELYVRVEGRGGHGAMPHQTIDPVLTAAEIIVALQRIVSRLSDATEPTVLTFGKINSLSGATNVIPEVVELEGTFRAMNETWRNKAHEAMVKIAETIAESVGAHCHFRIERGYPVLVNNPALTRRARKAAQAYMGAENVVELPMRMTAEDFAYYAQELPGCFYRLGTANPEKPGTCDGLHTSRFDIDEDALLYSPGLMAWLAIQELEAQMDAGVQTFPLSILAH